MIKRLHILITLLTAMLFQGIAFPVLAQDISIGTKTELEAFRGAVNEGNTYAGNTVTLTANITDVTGWGEGIGSDTTPFLGTFDGGGHQITLTGSIGLFGQVGKSGETTGTVKNLSVKAQIDGYKDYIGAIAGSSYGTIQYCFVEGSITSSKDYLGGIVGKNVGTIEDCYTTVSIKATGIVKRVGSIAGLNDKSNSNAGTIQRCYATGAVNNINTTEYGAGAGGIVGQNSTSAGTTIKNCIALNTSITGNTAGRIIISNFGGSDALADNYASPLIAGEWTEKEVGKKNGADLTEGSFITNATAEGGAFYGWNNGNTAWDFTTPANLPTLTGFTADQPVKDITRESTITKLLIKEIKTAADLATFRDAVNSGETYEGETVTLANDITVTGWEVGIGIEADKKPFSGTFDGQGHMINLTGSTSLFVLIGKANETYGTVKNLGVNAAITANTTNTGGIVGHSYGTIQNCYTKGTITNESNYTGGIAGDNGGTIQNCYSTALCTGNNATGGIVGKHSGTILQCYATGAINGKDSAGGIAGTFGGNEELKNCIALNTSITFTNTGGKSGRIISSPTASYLYNNHASPLLPGTLMEADKKDGANLTKENFIDVTTATGAFAEWPTSDDGWDLTTASLPTLKAFKDENNPQPAKSITRKEKLMLLTIASAGDLIKFRDAVNGGETYKGLTVKLTADITVEDWKDPIGTNTNSFLGTFDGDGHVITLTGSTSLFGYIGNPSNKTGLVKNLGVKATITPSLDNTGAIVRLNYGKIQNCFTEGSITSTDKGNPGGIAGKNEGTIEDCYSTASITAATSCAGGIVGYNNDGSTIQRCYATGAITNTGTYATAGGIAGNNSNGAIKNCIALNTSITGYIAGRITGQGGSNLSGNYASPLIPGEWTGKGAAYLNGADLTTTNFITPTGAAGTFAEWPTGDAGWDFGDNTNLPTLKGFKGDQPVKDITRVSRLLIFDIATADALAKFRDIVNGGETYEKETVTLTGDITVEEWKEEKGIGANYTKPFLGTFDGAGYVISLTGKTSLFTTLGKDGEEKGIVQNLGVKVDINEDTGSAGGIVSTNYGTVKQCYTTGKISGEYAGGIVGTNNGTVQDCYSTVSIEAQSGAGGIVQINKDGATIERCFATGAITGGNDATGGIVGDNESGAKIQRSIALNKSITASANLGRVAGKSGTGANILGYNYASPLISGTWNNKGLFTKDGLDLADKDFIDQGAGKGAFTTWAATAWDFGDNSCLPKLKTTGLSPDIVITGQGDGSGNMPARANFLEPVIEISTPVTYDATKHNGKPIRVLDNGIFTVNADGASFKKLTIEEGGQVVAEKAFTCGQLLAPRTLNNKWTAYGSPVEMKAVTTSAQTFHRLIGYTQTNTISQVWGSSLSSPSPVTTFDISDRYLIATDADNVPVTLTAPISGNAPVNIPADVAPTKGAALYNGIFLFCQNPTLHNVEIPGAYILNTDGTRFEQVEAGKVAIVKPFQSYIVANAATTNALKSLRVGEMPTANEQIVNSGFRIWGANGQLHLSAERASRVSIYSPSGQLLRTFTLTGEQTVTLGSGIYFVHSNNITYKVSL